MVSAEPALPEAHDPSQPSVARMYDYYLGGTHNFAIDRAAVSAVESALPEIRPIALENRAFLRRTVRWMAKQGIAQFIDIGSGLPTASNTHDVAQQLNPAATVVYVDIDPTAVRQAREIIAAQRQQARVGVVRASALHPGDILAHSETARLIDFRRPVGVVMMALVHFFLPAQYEPMFAAMRNALAPGSYFAMTHGTRDGRSVDVVERTERVYAMTPTPLYLRSKAEIGPIFQGLEMVEPGIVKVDKWKMDEAEEGECQPEVTGIWYGGVGKVV
ncbi:DUF574-domain-containing protein [Glonium stellatum]|uniref:DUF574-domain-containing protein n=1 Tax=Glonium stellatum TaxID=574774 RepID=A0A8E2ER68_9PEZI|nr:DUF574-domain-containing protein [Glonium stellatum]